MEEVEDIKGKDVCDSEERASKKAYKANLPVMIISSPRGSEVRERTTSRVIIQKPATFLYKENNRVP